MRARRFVQSIAFARHIGTAIWDFCDHVSWNGLNFTPVPAPGDVLDYLATALPGAANR